MKSSIVALAVAMAVGPLAAQLNAPVDRLPMVELDGLEPVVAKQLERARNWTLKTWKFEGATMEERMARLWDLAVAYHAYEFRQAAFDAYSLGVEWVPRDSRWSYGRGVLLAEMARYDEAVNDFRQVLNLDPDSVLARLRIALAWRETGKNQVAEVMLHEVLTQEPNNLAARAAMGELAIDLGQFEAGIEHLEWVLERVPEADRLHYPLAIAHRGLGDRAKAQTHLELRGKVGIRPDDPFIEEIVSTARGERLALIRGRAAYRAARYEEAVEAFTEALAFAPDSVRALSDRAAAATSLGKVDLALEDLERATRLDPENTTAQFNLARLHLHVGRPVDAAGGLAGVVERTPRDTEARRLLAQALRGSGRLAEAIAALEVVVELDPADESAHIDLAKARVAAQQFPEALMGVELAYRSMPDSGHVAHLLARLLASLPVLDLRDGARALDLAQLVYEARPTVSHAETVALSLAELGRCVEATEWQAAAIEAAAAEYSGERLQSLQAVAKRYSSEDGCRP